MSNLEVRHRQFYSHSGEDSEFNLITFFTRSMLKSRRILEN